MMLYDNYPISSVKIVIWLHFVLVTMRSGKLYILILYFVDKVLEKNKWPYLKLLKLLHTRRRLVTLIQLVLKQMRICFWVNICLICFKYRFTNWVFSILDWTICDSLKTIKNLFTIFRYGRLHWSLNIHYWNVIYGSRAQEIVLSGFAISLRSPVTI